MGYNPDTGKYDEYDPITGNLTTSDTPTIWDQPPPAASPSPAAANGGTMTTSDPFPGRSITPGLITTPQQQQSSAADTIPYSWSAGQNDMGGAYQPFNYFDDATNNPNLTSEQRGNEFNMASKGVAQVRNPYDYLIGHDKNYVGDMAQQQQDIGAQAQAGYGALQAQAGQAQQQGAMLQGLGGYAAQYGQDAAKGINAGAAGLGKSAQSMLSEGGSMDQRAAPSLDFGAQNGTLGSSLGFADQLGGMQQGPSGAQAMLQSGANQSMAQSLALSRSGRGFGGSAAGTAQALQQNAQTMQSVGNQSAMLRAQEDAQWKGQQAQNLGAAANIYQGAGGQFAGQTALGAQTQLAQTSQNDQARAQLYGLGQQGQVAALNAQGQAANTALQGINTGAGIYSQGSSLQQQGTQQEGAMLNAGTTAASQAGTTAFGMNQAQSSVDMAREGMVTQDYGIRSNIGIANDAAAAANRGAAITGIGAVLAPVTYGLSSIAAAGVNKAADQPQTSDRRAKKDVRQLDDMGHAFDTLQQGPPSLDQENPYQPSPQAPPRAAPPGPRQLDRQNPYTDLRPAQGYSYQYKDPQQDGQGQFAGPMAQDLEKSPATSGAVYTDPNGVKKIDTSRLSLVNTSAISDQQRKLDDLEAEIRAYDLGNSRPKRRPAPGQEST